MLHVLVPLVVVVALVLLVIGRRGRLFLRILVLGEPRRPVLSPTARRIRFWSALALLGAGLCAMRAAEVSVASVPQPWLLWPMAGLAVVLAVGGGIGLAVTGRRSRRLSSRAAGSRN